MRSANTSGSTLLPHPPHTSAHTHTLNARSSRLDLCNFQVCTFTQRRKREGARERSERIDSSTYSGQSAAPPPEKHTSSISAACFANGKVVGCTKSTESLHQPNHQPTNHTSTTVRPFARSSRWIHAVQSRKNAGDDSSPDAPRLKSEEWGEEGEGGRKEGRGWRRRKRERRIAEFSPHENAASRIRTPSLTT